MVVIPAFTLATWLFVMDTQSENSNEHNTTAFDEAHLHDLITYTGEILEKRYELYHWCEQKIASLATIDGVLLGSLFLLTNQIPTQDKPILSIGKYISVDTRTIFILVALEALISLIISLIVCLWHIIPLMDSKVGNNTNPRTVIGVESYKTPDDYHQALLKLNLEIMLRYNAFQIKGMNRNIWRDQKAIRYGVRASLSSLVGLTTLVLLLLFQ